MATMQGKDSQEPLQFRLMRRKDLPRVLEIERRSFRKPWEAERFASALDRSSGLNCIVIEESPSAAASKPKEIAGYFVLEIRSTRTHIVNLAIHPTYRRRGLASRCLELIEQIATKAVLLVRDREAESLGVAATATAEAADTARVIPDAPAHDGEIHLEVEEGNLAAQLLYRKMGYRATKILRNYYPELREDGYRMVRRILLPQASSAAEKAS